ncbi:MAG: YeeE/YedE thiosulfate transporter family protein [Eubacteriales bacterium]|nr:YeeE/YedE thiosulfate transporter family protein [Eubacteriales bacterium]
MKDIYRIIFADPWPFWAGGIVIGLLIPLLYYFHNTALGVSTGYGNFVKILFRPKKLDWINKQFSETISWRVYFIAGIVIGGFISARLSGIPLFSAEMGQFTLLAGLHPALTVIYFLAGGVLLGLGSRIAGGCTSGHSIHGIANLHFSSMAVTALFLVGGIIAANILRIILEGGIG